MIFIMDSLRYGFIGAGKIAHHAAKAVANHPDSRVIAAQDVNPGRLDELCRAHTIGDKFANFSNHLL